METVRLAYAIALVVTSVSCFWVSAGASINDEIKWTGFYVGANVGIADGTSQRNYSNGNTTGKFKISGNTAGGVFGYNKQLNRLVLGLEGDLSASNVYGTASHPNPDYFYETENNWMATLRPRLGYVVDAPLLPYLTGGLALGDVRAVISSVAGNRITDPEGHHVLPGWTIGAGVATRYPQSHWGLNIEYLYIKLPNSSNPTHDAGQTTTTSFAENLVRFGINYSY